MDQAEENRQVDRINAFRDCEKQIKLLDRAINSISAFVVYPLKINDIELQSPLSHEAMNRIRYGFTQVLDKEITLLKEEQEKI